MPSYPYHTMKNVIQNVIQGATYHLLTVLYCNLTFKQYSDNIEQLILYKVSIRRVFLKERVLEESFKEATMPQLSKTLLVL